MSAQTPEMHDQLEAYADAFRVQHASVPSTAPVCVGVYDLKGVKHRFTFAFAGSADHNVDRMVDDFAVELKRTLRELDRKEFVDE